MFPATDRLALPIDEILPRLVATLRDHVNLALRAPAGAGKTTRVPPALLDAGLAGDRQVVMLEPRRLAARAAARRIAAERGASLGGEVGYQVRFDRKAGPETRILVVTEGILVRMLQRDPFLEAVGAVLFDEFHERNLQSDLALAMTRRVQRDARDDLRIVVMSATLEPEPLAAFLGDAKVIESEGRLHPVEIRYLDRPDDRPISTRVAAAVQSALTDSPGDVLAFLPGIADIRRTESALESLAAGGLRVLSLYGDLPPEKQDEILRPDNRRKVVLATNVAESSITIDGVTAVVDSGLAKVMRFDPAVGLDRLEETRISRASADQRAGRAGRQAPGLCLRLWTRHDDLTLADHQAPEIRRVDLAGPALQLLAWGESDLESFGWFEAPAADVLERALALLDDLGARRGGLLTDIGQAMARLPTHPRLARLLVEGHRLGKLDRSIATRIAVFAALLSERDVVLRDGSRFEADAISPSDLLDRLEAVENVSSTGSGETASGPVHRGRARQVLRVAGQLERLVRRELRRAATASPPDLDGDSELEPEVATLLRALLPAFPDRLARRRRAGGSRAVMVGGHGVRLAASSSVREGELFLCLDLDRGRAGERSEALVRMASTIETGWIPEDQLETRTEAFFDGERERATGRRRLYYRDLVLAETEADPGPEEAARVLEDAAVADLERALDLDQRDVATFLARARSLSRWMPDLGLPSFDDVELRGLLPILTAGKRSFADLRRAPILPILQGALDHRQLVALDRHAPLQITVPSGSRVHLRYPEEPGEPPILAVRIQEMFGLESTPTVAAGRVTVLVHLLAPNQRPQQVTRDLASFWHSTYPQVRKELRARYPRHAWPEDPLSATPERRPQRRKK